MIMTDPIKNRPDRTVRIRMTVSFLDQHTCQVRLEDRGFGGLYRSSGKVWEKLIDLKKEGELL